MIHPLDPIITLLDQSPSGAIDPDWATKRLAERDEFREACQRQDFVGAACELADYTYYTAKGYMYYNAARRVDKSGAPNLLGIHLHADRIHLTIDDAIEACLAKYQTRFANNAARGGAGKDDAAERRAVAAVLLPRLEARMGTMDPLGSVDEQTAWDAAMDQRDALRETLRADA